MQLMYDGWPGSLILQREQSSAYVLQFPLMELLCEQTGHSTPTIYVLE